MRERRRRLEARADCHKRGSAQRHTLVLAAISDLRARLEKAEERSWKVLAAVAVG